MTEDEWKGLVAKLLDDPRFDDTVEYSKTWLRTFLKGQVERFHGNKLAEAARALQVDAASLSDWMSGHHRPTLGRVAAFADFYRCNIMDIVWGSSDAAQEPLSGVSPLVTYGRRAKLDRKGKENLRKEAEALFLEMPHIGAKGVADRLGVTTSTLRIAAPDIYKRLTAAWQASLDLAAQAAVDDFQRAAVQMMERGCLPTLTGVWAALKRSPVDSPGWVKERCREIIATIRPQKDLFDQAAGLGARAFTRQSPRYVVDEEGHIIYSGQSDFQTDWAEIGLPPPRPYRRSRRS